jgi:hypothetical protein
MGDPHALIKDQRHRLGRRSSPVSFSERAVRGSWVVVLLALAAGLAGFAAARGAAFLEGTGLQIAAWSSASKVSTQDVKR